MKLSIPQTPTQAGEDLVVSMVQADWLGVTIGDWRGMHGALWGLEMCGTPQNWANVPVNPYPQRYLGIGGDVDA